jgi:thiamine pyrophosphate-dependent acetolactate synthase large subunit-like protein
VRDHHRADELRDAIRWWPQAVEHRPWLEAITTAAGPETVFSLDSTQLAYSALNCLVRPAAAPRSWLVPNGYGTLGPALPMAIGAAVARPDRPAVAIAGDGGAMFTIAELATAAQLELPVVLIVWDSHSYQEIADSMIRASMPQIASDLNTVDFVALGQSLGCDALRVGSPDELHGALLAAIRAARPTVLHIPPARSVPS